MFSSSRCGVFPLIFYSRRRCAVFVHTVSNVLYSENLLALVDTAPACGQYYSRFGFGVRGQSSRNTFHCKKLLLLRALCASSMLPSLAREMNPCRGP